MYNNLIVHLRLCSNHSQNGQNGSAACRIVSTLCYFAGQHSRQYMYDSFMFQDRMNNINQLADDFVANDHFNADAIDNKRKSVAERFAALQEPLKAREEKLNDALKLQQYFRYSHIKDDKYSFVI